MYAAMQGKFVAFMRKHEKRFTVSQKKIILFSFCMIILLIHSYNIYQIFHPAPDTNKPYSHDGISVPQDITLPDSLDVQLIRKYREIKRRQDSLTLQQNQ